MIGSGLPHLHYAHDSASLATACSSFNTLSVSSRKSYLLLHFTRPDHSRNFLLTASSSVWNRSADKAPLVNLAHDLRDAATRQSGAIVFLAVKRNGMII